MSAKKIVASVVLSGVLFSQPGSGSGEPAAELIPLCDALRDLDPGEARYVTVSGVYEIGPELRMLYDPEEPECEWDVQPSTALELPEGVEGKDVLLDALRESMRAYVTIEGVLVGPGAAGTDDPSLPPHLALVKRLAGVTRYGHLNEFRTRLTATRVLRVGVVEESVPHAGKSYKTSSEGSVRVVSGEIPRYPEQARLAGISGVVEIASVIEKGRAHEVGARAGDRWLGEAASACLRTWEYEGVDDGPLRTVFEYRLSKRRLGDSSVRVSMQLPNLVVVDAPANGW